MTPSTEGIQITARLDAEAAETFDEIARRLGTTRTHAIHLAAHALRVQTGLIRDDAIRLVERAARIGGDDAEIVLTVTHDDDTEGYGVAVTVNGQPLEDVKATIFAAMAEIPGAGDPEAGHYVVKPPETITVGLYDLTTKARYSIGEIPLEEGATLTVPARDLPVRLAGVPDDRTAEQRFADTRMALQIMRAAGRLPEDDAEAEA